MRGRIRQEQPRTNLRNLILESARRVFAREGHTKISMRKLASEIGYSPATIYQHFESKAQLLDDLVEESFVGLLGALEATRQEDPERALKAGLRAYVTFGLENPHHYLFAFMLRGEGQRRVRYRPHAAFDYLRECVDRCLEGGRSGGLDAEIAAQILWASMHGLTSLLLVRPEFPWVDRTILIDVALDRVIGGVLSPLSGGH